MFAYRRSRRIDGRLIDEPPQHDQVGLACAQLKISTSTHDPTAGVLETVHHGIAPYVEPFELPEPRDEDMELARKLIEKAAE